MRVWAEVVIEKTNYKVFFRHRETQFKPIFFPHLHELQPQLRAAWSSYR